MELVSWKHPAELRRTNKAPCRSGAFKITCCHAVEPHAEGFAVIRRDFGSWENPALLVVVSVEQDADVIARQLNEELYGSIESRKPGPQPRHP